MQGFEGVADVSICPNQCSVVRATNDAGWAASDLQRVRAAYELMCRLFSGQYRPNGKPVVAHLTGVASILAAHGARLPVVLAGLSHAAYATGDFGGFWPRMTRAGPKRRRVSRIIGEEAEALLAHYTAFDWNERAAALARALPELSQRERDVVLMRLANELDEAADRSVLYGQPAGQQRRMERLSASIRIARNLNLDRLADELQEMYTRLDGHSVYAELVSNATKDYTIPAPSYRRRLIPAVSYGLKTLWWKLPAGVRSRFLSWTHARALKGMIKG